MAFPPLVSSSPPPLEQFDEEEDEFGDFNSTGLDGLSLSSGSPQKLPTPMKSPINIPVLTQNQYKVHTADIHETVTDRIESSSTESLEVAEISDTKKSTEDDLVLEYPEEEEYVRCSNDSENSEKVEQEYEHACSPPNEIEQETDTTSPVQERSIEIPECMEEQDDDFGEFEEASTVQPSSETIEESSEQQITDEFGEFESSVNVLQSIQRIENQEASNKIEDILRTMFPQKTLETLGISVGGLIGNSDNVWLKIKNVEESHALNFHWNGSNTNNMMLEALGIDSRNILFGPKWNPNVPRFAANLGLTPLEPVKACAEKPLSIEKNEKATEEVPAAQFDWNSSGLVNPLESSGGTSALLPLDLLFDPLLTPEVPLSRKMARNPLNIEEKEEKRKKQESRRRGGEGIRRKSREGPNLIQDRNGRQMAVQPETMKILKKLPDLTFLSARTLMLDRSLLENQLAG